jgi:hypothetical protein
MSPRWRAMAVRRLARLLVFAVLALVATHSQRAWLLAGVVACVLALVAWAIARSRG